MGPTFTQVRKEQKPTKVKALIKSVSPNKIYYTQLQLDLCMTDPWPNGLNASTFKYWLIPPRLYQSINPPFKWDSKTIKTWLSRQDREKDF